MTLVSRRYVLRVGAAAAIAYIIEAHELASPVPLITKRKKT